MNVKSVAAEPILIVGFGEKKLTLGFSFCQLLTQMSLTEM